MALKNSTGVFNDADIQSSAFVLSARYNLAPLSGFWPDAFAPGRSALTVSLAQPLRVEHGMLSALLPEADAYGRSSLHYVARRVPLNPSGRELDLRLGLDVQLHSDFIARAELAEIFEPGHVRSASPETMVSVGARWAF